MPVDTGFIQGIFSYLEQTLVAVYGLLTTVRLTAWDGCSLSFFPSLISRL